MNIPLHRCKEAENPPTHMREEYHQCTKQIPLSLAHKLFSAPSQEDQVQEDQTTMLQEEMPNKAMSVNEITNTYADELVFKIEL